ncbi:putative ribonuclease H-like domain-containing protein [Tanacetum coccineum]
MSSMGELTFFLGLKVIQKDDGIFISQDKYVDEILKKFGFSTMKTISTPMETSKPLLKDAKAKDVDVYLYRSMIGSLMYLTSSRPNIMFVVCACARFQVTPKVSHLYAMKRIFRYLKGQPKLGLWKSTTGGCQFLGSRLISWQCKKQTIVANSTTKAEYVAAASCFKNPVFHSKTKHIEIRHHFIRDSNEKKLIQMIKIHTDQNVADLLTKAFDVGRFQYLIATANDEIQVSVVGLTFYVLDLENTKTSQAAEITKLKERVKKLERRNKSRTLGLKRLRKVGRSAQVVSSKDEGLGAQEDASKQGRKIVDLDADAEVTLVDEAQERNDDNLMFDTRFFDEQEVEVEKVVSTAEVITASAATTTVDELTLVQTLIEIKAAKPKAITTAATTTTTAVTRPKARGVVVQKPSEFTTTTPQPSQLPQAKDKGKAKMIEPEKPLKKKDQILMDEEIAQRLQEELQVELEEEERVARQKEEEHNLIS